MRKFYFAILLVLLVPALSSSAQSAVSTFDKNDEGWRVVGDATSAIPQYFDPGGNPGGYISASDQVTGGVWYWSAPAKFIGNKSSAYNGNFQFDLKQSGLNDQFDTVDVFISGSGITLACDLSNPSITWTHYEVALNTKTRWTLDTLHGVAASEEDIQKVLANITNIRIRGEYIFGSDRGDLDNVILPGNVLPLDLITFTASQKNDIVSLQWKTGNETKNSFYEIEYSDDGSAYKVISTIKATANYNLHNVYTFDHNSPGAGNKFYRLKMVDNFGSSQYSPVVKISTDRRIKLQIFPNPTTGKFTVSGLPVNKKGKLQLVDLQGRMLKEILLTASSTFIDIGEMPAGLYMIRINIGDQMYQSKMIKQ